MIRDAPYQYQTLDDIKNENITNRFFFSLTKNYNKEMNFSFI